MKRASLVGVVLLLATGAYYLGGTPDSRPPEPAASSQTAPLRTALAVDAGLAPRPTPPPVAPAPSVAPAPAQNDRGAVADWRTYDPEQMTFAAYPDLPVRFHRADSYMNTKLDRHVWVGTSETDGTFVATAASKDEMVAVLAIPGADTYELTVTNQGTTVRQVPMSGETCMPQVPKAPYPEIQQSITQTQVAADIATVDVAVFYNPDVLAAAGSESSILTTVLARFTASNQALVNSSVTNFQWNVLGVYPVATYPTTTNLTDDLSAFGNTTSALGAFALAKSVEVGADQSLLLVGGTRTDGYGGVAYEPGHYSVVLWNQTSYTTIAHELAHNFGCDHDRATAKAADGDGKYNYGNTLTVGSAVYGTIMSYNGARIGYFSNPNVTYQNVPTGIAVDQPKAAYNAKVLTDYAPTMAAYRAAPSAPVITAQPVGSTVTTGSTFSLSVTATGTNLSYQWYKAGVAITGATASSYSKTAALDDQTSFYVTVKNALGSVDSSSVTAFVSAPAAPATPSASVGGSSGGGGGGGGVTSPWFILALTTLTGARYFRPRRQ